MLSWPKEFLALMQYLPFARPRVVMYLRWPMLLDETAESDQSSYKPVSVSIRLM